MNKTTGLRKFSSYETNIDGSYYGCHRLCIM